MAMSLMKTASRDGASVMVRFTPDSRHSDYVPGCPLRVVSICVALGHVRFTPNSGHVRCNSRCLLWANSGHWLSLWRNSGEILDHVNKSLRSDFHRASKRMSVGHDGQQPGKDHG